MVKPANRLTLPVQRGHLKAQSPDGDSSQSGGFSQSQPASPPPADLALALGTERGLEWGRSWALPWAPLSSSVQGAGQAGL